MPDTPAPQTESDTGLHNPNIIVPAQRDTSAFSEFSGKATTTIKEYVTAARALKIPIPKFPKHDKPASKPVQSQQIPPKPHSVPQSGTSRGKPIPKPHAPSYRPSNTRIVSEYIEAALGDAHYSQIVSQYVLDPLHPSVVVVGLLFKLLSLVYIMLSLTTLAAIGILAMSLYNSGSLPYLFLRFYPLIGLLPVLTTLFAYISLYSSYMVVTSSRKAWTLALSVMILLPPTTYIFLPQIFFPLMKLILVYLRLDGTPFLPNTFSVGILMQYFHYILLFYLGLVVLLPSKKYYTRPVTPMTRSGKMWLSILLYLGIIPQMITFGLLYFRATTTDFNYGPAAGHVTYTLYRPSPDALGRTPWTNYQTGISFAGVQDAVTVTYDVPLTEFVEDSIRSPITFTQVKILPDFSLISFVEEQKRDAGTVIENAAVLSAKNSEAYITMYNGELSLWFITPKDVLIRLSSDTADISELTSMANGME